MKKEPIEKILYKITEEDVQNEAREGIQRELTKKELQEVGEKLYENNWHITEMINESIAEVIDWGKLMRRNKKAETQPNKYLVYWKNENAFQKDYKEVFTALSEKDAREYVDLDGISRSEFDEYRITKRNKDTETEIATIRPAVIGRVNCGPDK